MVEPAGMIQVKIDPATGLLAHAAQKDAIFETFRQASAPTQYADDVTHLAHGDASDHVDNEAPLF